jgi:hypothetical protein
MTIEDLNEDLLCEKFYIFRNIDTVFTLAQTLSDYGD